MTTLLWSRDAPARCACGGAYQPQLNKRGRLVKSREPAWRMSEQTRDPGCLQERCRALAGVYRLGYQHHKTSKGSGAGYPDVHLWTRLRPGGGGSLFMELKRMGKDPTDAQIRVMGELQDAGHPAYLVRPCCLLTGVLDEIMAGFAGSRCFYVKAGPAYTPVEVPAGAPIPAAGPTAPASCEPTLVAPPRRRPLFRTPPPPGADPVPFAPATGYVIPAGEDPAGRAALEVWLRAAGFSPADVPYPIRLVVGDQMMHVQCRVGLARAGADERVWRGGTPASPFPRRLIARACAVVAEGLSSAAVAAEIAQATTCGDRIDTIQ